MVTSYFFVSRFKKLMRATAVIALDKFTREPCEKNSSPLLFCFEISFSNECSRGWRSGRRVWPPFKIWHSLNFPFSSCKHTPGDSGEYPRSMKWRGKRVVLPVVH